MDTDEAAYFSALKLAVSEQKGGQNRAPTMVEAVERTEALRANEVQAQPSWYDYLQNFEWASDGEIARLEQLTNGHGTIMELQDGVTGRILVQGVSGLIYFDENTKLVDGRPLREQRTVLNEGDTVDVVMEGAKRGQPRRCTGILKEASSDVRPALDPVDCHICHGIIISITADYAIAMNTTQERVLLLPESLPHDEEMADLATTREPKSFGQFPWMQRGRTVLFRSAVLPKWLKEQQQQANNAARICSKLAIDVKPFERSVFGFGVISQVEDNGGLIQPDNNVQIQLPIYFSKLILPSELRGGRILVVGERLKFEACRELPNRAYQWRAITVELQPPGTPPISEASVDVTQHQQEEQESSPISFHSPGVRSLLEDLEGLDPFSCCPSPPLQTPVLIPESSVTHLAAGVLNSPADALLPDLLNIQPDTSNKNLLGTLDFGCLEPVQNGEAVPGAEVIQANGIAPDLPMFTDIRDQSPPEARETRVFSAQKYLRNLMGASDIEDEDGF